MSDHQRRGDLILEELLEQGRERQKAMSDGFEKLHEKMGEHATEIALVKKDLNNGIRDTINTIKEDQKEIKAHVKSNREDIDAVINEGKKWAFLRKVVLAIVSGGMVLIGSVAAAEQAGMIDWF